MASKGKSDKALRTIGEVAEELNLATHVLRFWESKFHQIKPQKRRGRRYYRPEDVSIITKIKELLYEKGYTIRGVQKFLLEESKNKNNKAVVDKENKPTATVSPEKLNPALFSNQNSAPAATSFKTDMFGNIVPANAAPVAGVGNQAVQTVEKKYSPEDVEKLKEIYSGLQQARRRLKEVA